ncbi:MAG: acyl-CoA dehydratase activase [Candidatus Binatia bacterium]
MIVAGCDVGSIAGKVVILKDGEILSSSIVPNEPLSDVTANKAMEQALAGTGITRKDFQSVIGTGYGRIDIPFAQKIVTEIACHGKGAHWANNKARTVIDVGGQDAKVIKVDGEGVVKDFVLNDKCAAGTGKFLDTMCRILDVKLEEMGELSLNAQNPVEISSQCSVFAESEVVSLIAEKKNVIDILAGINHSVANRLISMLYRIGIEEDVVISGGVAKNIGVVRMIEEKIKVNIPAYTIDPQIYGALGAALFAQQESGA